MEDTTVNRLRLFTSSKVKKTRGLSYTNHSRLQSAFIMSAVVTILVFTKSKHCPASTQCLERAVGSVGFVVFHGAMDFPLQVFHWIS